MFLGEENRFFSLLDRYNEKIIQYGSICDGVVNRCSVKLEYIEKMSPKYNKFLAIYVDEVLF